MAGRFTRHVGVPAVGLPASMKTAKPKRVQRRVQKRVRGMQAYPDAIRLYAQMAVCVHAQMGLLSAAFLGLPACPVLGMCPCPESAWLPPSP